jgi:hypothetical protein
MASADPNTIANATAAAEKNVAGGIELQTPSRRGLVMKMPSAGVAWTNSAHTVADVARKATVAPTNVSGKTLMIGSATTITSTRQTLR